MSQCECDYDAQGDPLEYVKTSHRICPEHDNCSSCVDNIGKHRIGEDWLCDECKEYFGA